MKKLQVKRTEQPAFVKRYSYHICTGHLFGNGNFFLFTLGQYQLTSGTDSSHSCQRDTWYYRQHPSYQGHGPTHVTSLLQESRYSFVQPGQIEAPVTSCFIWLFLSLCLCLISNMSIWERKNSVFLSSFSNYGFQLSISEMVSS